MIFVTGTTGRTCGEKICHVEKFQISSHLPCGEIWNCSTSIMWRKLRFLHMTDVENRSCLHLMDVEQFHISPYDRCGEYEFSLHGGCGEFHHLLIYQINNVYNLRCFMYIMLFCCKICSFCDLRCFVEKSVFVAIYALLRGEKLSQKLCLWRKKDKYHVW